MILIQSKNAVLTPVRSRLLAYVKEIVTYSQTVIPNKYITIAAVDKKILRKDGRRLCSFLICNAKHLQCSDQIVLF